MRGAALPLAPRHWRGCLGNASRAGGAALAAAWPWLNRRPSPWPSWDLQGRDKPQDGSELPSLMSVALRHGFARSFGCVVGVDAVL